MPSEALSAFVRLFADSTELRQSFQGLVPEAKRAGLTVSEAFAQGMRGGPSAGASALAGIAGGPTAIPAAAARFQPLFERTGDDARRGKAGVDDFGLSVRDVAGSVRLLAGGILSQLNPVLGDVGNVALAAAGNLRVLGVGMAAGGAAAAGAALGVGLYIGRVKEAMDAQIALANAVRRADFAEVSQLVTRTSDAIGTFSDQTRIAGQEITGLWSASQVILAFWARAFGPGIEELTKRMAEQVEQAKKLFLAQDAPKQQGLDLAFRRRHLDALIALGKASVEAEGNENRSLAVIFQERTALLRAQTRSELDALEEQSAAKRGVIRERLKTALDPERLQLERDLTNVSKEEGARRLEIQSQAVSRSLELLEQDRQNRLKIATSVFTLEKSLGIQAADADVKRWAEVARAAVAGSQVQIDALGKVAEAQRALQVSGQSLVDQALGAADALAARSGRPSPLFVSKRSLADAARERERIAEETARTFERGGRVRRADFELIRPAQQFKEQAGQFGDTFTAALTQAFAAARAPVRAAFEASIGGALTDATQGLFASTSAGFANLATGFTRAFDGVRVSIKSGVAEILDDLRTAETQIVQAIADQVEEKITRRLEAAARAQ